MKPTTADLDDSESIRADALCDSDEEKLLKKNPVGFYGRDEIALMLHADAVARKKQQWELISSDEILTLGSQLNTLRATGIGFDKEEVMVISDSRPRPLRSPFVPFRERFIFVDTILNAFPGKLIVAGGSVFKAFMGSNQRVNRQLFGGHNNRELLSGCDVDFFFIDCTKEEVEQIIRFVWDFLHDAKAIARVTSKMENLDPDDVYYSCIDRCQNTTTIYYSIDEHDADWMAEYGWEEGGKMQFIHRIYPNKASVIGGFDLGPCMAFYDGHDFWATPFGAWSIATQTIILDVSRRSTSFEYRIGKYVDENNCRLVLVNGSNAEAFQYLASEPHLARRRGRIFYPVNGFKTISWHVPHAKYEGLDDRIKIADEKKAQRKKERKEAGEDGSGDGGSGEDQIEKNDELHNPLRFHQAQLFGAMGLPTGQRYAVDQKALNREIDQEADEQYSGEDQDSEEQQDGGPVLALGGLAALISQQDMVRIGMAAPGEEEANQAVMNAMHGISFYEDGERVDPDDPDVKDQQLLIERRDALAYEEKSRNAFRCCANSRRQISDYDGGQFNAFSLAEANAIFAAKGKIDCITWRSETTEGAFEKPVFKFKLHPAMEITADVVVEELPEELYIDALRRWFPEDVINRLKSGPTRAPQVVSVHQELFRQEVLALRQRVEENIQMATARAMRGITIITENPGRQWTASNNPVVGDVRLYYHPVLLAERGPLKIGVPDKIFCLLVFARTRDEADCSKTWRRLPRDVFNLIMRTLADLLAIEGNHLLLGHRL